MTCYYVYLHRKKTTGEVFYVGKGKGCRANQKASRSSSWKSAFQKHGVDVEIVEKDIQEWYALELESNLIDYYGRSDLGQGSLVNKKDGHSFGRGFSGSGKEDLSKYTFLNIETGEEITETRRLFKKMHPDVNVMGLFYGCISSKNWIIPAIVSESDLVALENDFKGFYSKLASKKEFHLFNFYTGCEFIGNRHDFQKTFGFKVNHLFRPDKVVSYEKGWCIYSEKDKVKDAIAYHFISKGGEEFIGTRTEFNHKYNIVTSPLFKHPPCLSVRGWALFKNKDVAFIDGYDKTVYKFIHKNGEIFEGTCRAIEKKFEINIQPLFGKSCTKTQRGWSLVKEESISQ